MNYQFNGVTIQNIPTTETNHLDLTTVDTVTKLTAFAGLYELEEIDYNLKFLVEPYIHGDSCPHCQNVQEVSVPQSARNEIVVVPCVCSPNYVAPNAGDAAFGREEEAPVVAQIAQPIHAHNLNPATTQTHFDNTVAFFKSAGYDFTGLEGQEVQVYQIIVAGDGAVNTQKILSTFTESQKVFMACNQFNLNTTVEFETPRIQTMTEIATNRTLKDLRQVSHITTLIALAEQDLENRQSIESQDISRNPGQYRYNENLLKNFVRTVSSIGRLQNARTEVGGNGGVRILNTYYRHTETEQTYLFSIYYMDDSGTPSNYTIVRETPSELDAVVTTEDYTQRINALMEDLSNTMA